MILIFVLFSKNENDAAKNIILACHEFYHNLSVLVKKKKIILTLFIYFTQPCYKIACSAVFISVFLSLQPLELICEKAIATCNRPLGAGEALRRVMECLASGILLPGTKPWCMHE